VEEEMSLTAKTAPVLVADDDPALSQALAATLRNAGYSVQVAVTGGQAMAYVRDHRILAAVVDIHMPDVHGLVLSQQLRAACGPAIPILILSGDSSMSVINSLPFAGATYYFRKPVVAKLLLDKLAELLNVDRLAASEPRTK
jgi:DNA-binding response OmpR family regulator